MDTDFFYSALPTPSDFPLHHPAFIVWHAAGIVACTHTPYGQDALLPLPWQRMIVDALSGENPLPESLLDIHTATHFKQMVWRALLHIPFGQTYSYQQLAQYIGIDSGARAVGNACASNPLVLLVPCHRVIKADGRLGAYSWSGASKADLLAYENQLAHCT